MKALSHLRHAVNRELFKVYARVKYPPPVWKLLNHKRVSLFHRNRPELNEVQQKIVTDLQKEGISITTLEKLFPSENVLEAFKAEARRRESVGSLNHKKQFLEDYWDECVELDFQNPFLKYALSPTILDTVNTYMEMYTNLIYFTLQKTIPSGNSPLRNSQNWHRDPQEFKIVKVFCYLNDVDMSAGPFTYVPQSAPGFKKYGKLFPQQLPAGSYPGNENVERTIPKEDIHYLTGKAGTVIFCNTNGIHKGGDATASPRLMSTFGYTSGTYRENRNYYFDMVFLNNTQSLPLSSQMAVRRKWLKKK